MKESLYNYHRHFYNYWYFHFIAIMLNSVLTLRVLVSSLFLPPCGAVTLPPFRDTVTPLQNTKTNGLEERSWPHALGALCREAKAPHFTRAKKIKTLICHKAGRRNTIDEIARKSRFNIAPSQTSDSLCIKANECRKHMLLVLPRGLL